MEEVVDIDDSRTGYKPSRELVPFGVVANVGIGLVFTGLRVELLVATRLGE